MKNEKSDQLIIIRLILFAAVLIVGSINTATGASAWVDSAGAGPIDLTFQTNRQAFSKAGLRIDVASDEDGGSFSSQKLVGAINRIGPLERVVLVLKAGTWKVDRDLLIPKNISVSMEPGAILLISSGRKVVLEGTLMADGEGIFRGAGTVVFQNTKQDVNVNWWKDKNLGLYNNTIQSALSSGAKSVYFPARVYDVSIEQAYSRGATYIKPIQIPSNVHVHGEGEKSIIRLVNALATKGIWAANDVFIGTDIENVLISGLTFEGEKFYPDPETVSRQDPLIRGTRAINISRAKNCRISGCRFHGFTNQSIQMSGTNISIDGNHFYHGSYRTQTIRLDGSRFVRVSNNFFDDNGPHYYMVPGRHDETMSTDAIMVGNDVDNAYIINNRITGSSGAGIRVEFSKNVHVIGNTIHEVGREGITFYRGTKDSACINNSITNWGKIPDFGYLRSQNGKIYNPKEYHYSASQLPLHLGEASTWEVNRYYVRTPNGFVIPEYDHTTSERLFAFRGFAAISVTEGSKSILIAENHISGNRTKTNDLFNYACNYGIAIGVHAVNPPVSSNGECIISNNAISDCIDYDLYCPQYIDPSAKKGIALDSVVFGNICDPSRINFFYVK